MCNGVVKISKEGTAMVANTYALPRSEVESRAFITRVYAWMFVALAVTSLAAFITASTPEIIGALVTNDILFWGLIISELLLVVVLSRAIERMSSAFATGMFLVYSLLNGVTLSLILHYYTEESIALTFFVTAGTFGLMSVYGFVTQRDLTSIGNLLLMALVGFILGTIVNIFVASSTLYWILTYAGILIFVGLTAYDTQKIKRMSGMLDAESDQGRRAAILGALALYLDFINLFLLLLRLLGRRK
jgi:FtsH-binding integral membrane protein